MKVKFKVKPKKTMGEYIAIHNEVPHLPKKFKKIKDNEVWVREDWWKDPVKKDRIKTHEKVELNLMDKGIKYKEAHKIANKFEKNMLKKKRR